MHAEFMQPSEVFLVVSPIAVVCHCTPYMRRIWHSLLAIVIATSLAPGKNLTAGLCTK